MSFAKRFIKLWNLRKKGDTVAELALRLDPHATREHVRPGEYWSIFHFSDGSMLRSRGLGRHHRLEIVDV